MRRPGGTLAAALTLALLGVPVPAAHGSIDTQLFTVDITATATKGESGNLFAFDSGTVTANAYGPDIFASLDGLERSEHLTAARGDDLAQFGVAFDVGTKVKATCKAQNPSFRGAASGSGKLEATFEDGFPGSIIYEAWGTGQAKAAASIRANGDLKYPKEGLGSTAKAVSSGDVDVKELSAEVELPGGAKITFSPKDGEGTKVPEDPLVASDSTTVNKGSFEVELLSYANAFIQGSDSFGGRASSRSLVDVTQTLDLTGSCTFENLISGLALNLKVPASSERPFPSDQPRPPLPIGTLRVVTVEQPSGMVVEDITRTLRDDGESLYLSSSKPIGGDVTQTRRIDSTWANPNPRDIAFSASAGAAQRFLLGVGRGSSAVYAVRGRRSGLARLRRFGVRVRSIRRRGGNVVLATVARYRGGRRFRTTLVTNPLTGKGEVRGFLIPLGRKVGQRVYGGLGRVVAANDRRVVVAFRKGSVRARARYDARTGMLQRITERAPRGVVTTLRRIR